MTKINTKEVTLKQVKAALKVIGGFFHEESTNADGEVINRMKYAQKALLNGMCWKAHREIERLERETLPKAADELAWLVRRYGAPHAVDERIAGKQLWIQTLEDQLLALRAFAEVAEEVFYDCTGEIYGRGVPEAKAETVDPTSAALIAKYGKQKAKGPELRNSPAIDSDHRDTAMH